MTINERHLDVHIRTMSEPTSHSTENRALHPHESHTIHRSQARFARWVFQVLFTLVTLPFRVLLHPVIIYLALLLGVVLLISALAPVLFNYVIAGASTQLFKLVAFANPSFGWPITYLLCTLLPGPSFCSNDASLLAASPPATGVSTITQSVTTNAKLASNIFESVVGLGDASNWALYQTEILEIELAVKHSTALDGQDVLADQLLGLNSLLKNVSDQVIALNSQGVNTFSFLALEVSLSASVSCLTKLPVTDLLLCIYKFSKLQDLTELTKNGNPRYSDQTLSHNLKLLFDHLHHEFSRLLLQIDDLLTLVSAAIKSVTGVSRQLLGANYQLVKTKESAALWSQILNQHSWASKQLNRDIAFTSTSAECLSKSLRQLENLRNMLVAYRRNVAVYEVCWFVPLFQGTQNLMHRFVVENVQPSLVRWHLVDHQLSAEDEVCIMRHIITNFQNVAWELQEKKNHEGTLALES